MQILNHFICVFFVMNVINNWLKMIYRSICIELISYLRKLTANQIVAAAQRIAILHPRELNFIIEIHSYLYSMYSGICMCRNFIQSHFFCLMQKKHIQFSRYRHKRTKRDDEHKKKEKRQRRERDENNQSCAYTQTDRGERLFIDDVNVIF